MVRRSVNTPVNENSEMIASMSSVEASSMASKHSLHQSSNEPSWTGRDRFFIAALSPLAGREHFEHRRTDPEISAQGLGADGPPRDAPADADVHQILARLELHPVGVERIPVDA